MSTTILFISHQASQTGAPIVLLHLLRWLKQHTKLKLLVLFREGGVLQPEFEQLAQTFVWEIDPPITIWENRLHRLKLGPTPAETTRKHKQEHQQRIMAELQRLAPQLVYANTVVVAELAIALRQTLRCPVLCHVHELEFIIEETIGNARLGQLSEHIAGFVAASEAVAVNLRETCRVPASKVTTVHEFVPILEITDFQVARQRIRQELAIPNEALLVLASGTLEWRKGPELFIQVAQQVQQAGGLMPHFVWLGGGLENHFGLRSQYDLARAGINQHLRFIGARPNAHDYISAADIFVLTSREDPYPLVCLEAGSLGKPIICFANSGGMPEFVEHDCGIVVPYLRTDFMAKAVVRLRDNEPERLQFGINAARKLRARHTVEIAGQQIQLIIENTLAVTH